MVERRPEEILREFGREKRGHYSLDKISAALESVGNPNRTVYCLIVGGTNGKGSCSLLISSALREAGFQVDTYLSPHLQSPCERFLRNMAPISEAELVEWMERALPTARQHELSYFEFLTLIAFMRAGAEKTQFLVLEVGLGGRLDATNLCDPIASVISNIGLDHQEFLGNDEATILKEKLAIVRPEGLLFTGVTDEKLVQQIEQHCVDIDAIPYYSREVRAKVLESGFWGQRVEINGYPFELTCPTRATLENAKTSLLLMRILFPKLEMEIFQRAFARVVLPARFETLQEHPRVILSGDHNPQAVQCLLETLAPLRGQADVHTYAAFSPDKDFESMIPRLTEISKSFTLGFIPGFETSMPESYQKHSPDSRPASEVVGEIIANAKPDDIVLIAGSLYLAGALRPRWKESVFFENFPRHRRESGRRLDGLDA